VITSDQISAQFAASQQAQMAAMQQASLYGQTPAFSPAASSSGALGMMGATEMGASIGMNLAWMRAGFSSGALASSASMLGFPAVLGAEYLMGKAYGGAKRAYQDEVLLNSQYQHLNPGGQGGRGFGKGGVDQISDATEMLARELQQDVQEIQKARTHLGNVGAMFGITEVEQFTKKMRETIKLVSTMSESLGGTLSEASVLFQHSRSTGFFTPSDVLGMSGVTKTASNMLGMPINEVMGIQRGGAAGAHQYGMRSRVGASLSTDYLMRLQLMYQSGDLTDDELDLATGMAGKEGIQAMAQQMTNASMALTRTNLGKAMTIAMSAQDQQGRFTGEIDADVAQQLRRGELTADQMKSLAGGKMGSGVSQASYKSRERELAGLMAGAGGVEIYAQMFRGEMVRGGRGFDTATDITRSQMQDLGLGEALSRTVTGMAGSLEDLDQRSIAKVRQTIEATRMEEDRKLNGTWGGLFKRAGAALDDIAGKAARDIGTSWYRNLRGVLEGIGDEFFGRNWAGDPLTVSKMGMEGADRILSAGGQLPSIDKLMGGGGFSQFDEGNYTNKVSGFGWLSHGYTSVFGRGLESVMTGSDLSDYRSGGGAIPQHLVDDLAHGQGTYGYAGWRGGPAGMELPFGIGSVGLNRASGGSVVRYGGKRVGTTVQYHVREGRNILDRLRGMDRGKVMGAYEELRDFVSKGLAGGDFVDDLTGFLGPESEGGGAGLESSVYAAIKDGTLSEVGALVGGGRLNARALLLALSRFGTDEGLSAESRLPGILGRAGINAENTANVQSAVRNARIAGRLEKQREGNFHSILSHIRSGDFRGISPVLSNTRQQAFVAARNLIGSDRGEASSLALRLLQGTASSEELNLLTLDDGRLDDIYHEDAANLRKLYGLTSKFTSGDYDTMSGPVGDIMKLETAKAGMAAGSGYADVVRSRLRRVERLNIGDDPIMRDYKLGLQRLGAMNSSGYEDLEDLMGEYGKFYGAGAGGRLISAFGVAAGAGNRREMMRLGKGLGMSEGLPRQVGQARKMLSSLNRGTGGRTLQELESDLINDQGMSKELAAQITGALESGGKIEEREMTEILTQVTKNVVTAMVGDIASPGEQHPMGVILKGTQQTADALSRMMDSTGTFAEALGKALSDVSNLGKEETTSYMTALMAARPRQEN
jgi:hypothetical protein